jgi:hypothetical protein
MCRHEHIRLNGVVNVPQRQRVSLCPIVIGIEVQRFTTALCVKRVAGGYATVYLVSLELDKAWVTKQLDSTDVPATCFISNRPGFPKFTTMQNNTFLSVGPFSINAFNNYWQPISNQFFNNVVAVNDSHLTSGFYCSNFLEGVTSLPCWDTSTLSFYSNVLVGRAAAQWTVAGTTFNCPSPGCGSFPNFVPPNGSPSGIGGAGGGVNCAGATANANCMGWSGFMSGSPTVTYPSVPCVYDGSDPTNCPLMALPWANNFSLSNISYVGSSSYSAYGVDTTKMTDAMTNTYARPAPTAATGVRVTTRIPTRSTPSHAIESPDAQSGKTQSRKSESFALDALSPLWTRDRAGGTAPRRLRASPVPPVQTGIHSGQAERLTDKLIPVDLGITGLASVTAVDLASHPP